MHQGIHDYTLSIPPLLFGIPYSSESAWAGNVFWTIGHAHNTTLIQNINPSFEVREILFCGANQY